MRVFVKKSGDNISVEIPSGVMQSTRLALDDAVEVREEDGRIIIEPIGAPKYDLAQMIENITPENLHDEISVGAAVGKESY